jgi:tetratricopeptide (TPR) repeat protein
MFFRIVLISSLVIVSTVSNAGKYTIYPMTDLELTMLPPYCTPWQKGDEAATDAWVKKLSIPNIHHLCKGLNHLNHAIIITDKTQREYQLNPAIAEFSYIIDHATVKGLLHFPMKGFVLFNRGKARELLGDKTTAISDYQLSIKENPKFTRSYAALFDIYLSNGKKDNAFKLLEKGLKHSPNSKLLLKKKKQLNVK